ncbi:MAG: hypothetical protein K0U93_28560 [Gammaproteobacteria bacterium]|nr:hypothetical protein [Gammaproteobacteria bacterium]
MIRDSREASNLKGIGYLVAPAVLTTLECSALGATLPSVCGSGTRMILQDTNVQAVVPRLRSHPILSALLTDLVAVQCTYFRKTQAHNWSLRVHRDALVPLSGRGAWETVACKEGQSFVRPPPEFLRRCLALRLNLDDALEGDLRIVPRSWNNEQKFTNADAISVKVPQGGALLFRPTAAHGSAKLIRARQRRVLHFLFAPRNVPAPYRWPLTL